MQYSSFPSRINVEKTFEQYLQPLLLPENQKSSGKGEKNLSTGLESRQMDGRIEWRMTI